ncbi:CidA/LrgA family protein [Comamonas sp. J-3]|jgi:holin-like protein|uniref:CidA/LrgA family protein n=1 Tax=Comamonas trifloxystrobinivorans TaxID=3350256 RepID=UPI003727784A
MKTESRAAAHAPAAAVAPAEKSETSPAGESLQRITATALQVLLLCAIWLAAEALRSHMGWKMPAGLIGFAVLAVGLFSRIIKTRWFASGTRWLLSDMLLFFIPGLLVVVNYGDLVRNQGLRILLVIVLSTVCVMAATAVVVDAVYRLELRLAQRKRTEQRALNNAKEVL